MHSRRSWPLIARHLITSCVVVASLGIGVGVLAGPPASDPGPWDLSVDAYGLGTVSTTANLAVTLTAEPVVATTGDQVTYVLTAINNGPDEALSVTVADDLPTSVTFVSCQTTAGTCGGAGNSRTVTFASLAPGQSETVSLVASVDCAIGDGTVISNTASIAADASTPDPSPGDNTDTAVIVASNPPPVITCPADMTRAYPIEAFPVRVDSGATATDNCPGVALVYEPDAVQAGGAPPVQVTAIDSGRASASCQFSVWFLVETTTTVGDTTGQFGDPVSICATVEPPTVLGRVQFSIDGNVRGTAPYAPFCLWTGYLDPYFIQEPQGTHTITATFIPESGSEYQGSSGSATLTVLLEDVIVGLEGPNPSVYYTSDVLSSYCAIVRPVYDFYCESYLPCNDMCKAVPVTVTFTPEGSGAPIVLTAQPACGPDDLYACVRLFGSLSPGVYGVRAEVGGDYYHGSSQSATLTVVPGSPLDPITGPVDPVTVNSNITVRSEYTDDPNSPAHWATWDWGDGGWSEGTIDAGTRVVEGSHSYSQPGIYTVTLTALIGTTWATAEFRYVVVYDPDGGFVTGGGWIDSPAGSYAPDPAVVGRLTFGFESRYQAGESSPTGNAEIHFSKGDLKFHADTCSWMTISGPDARLMGVGTLDGQGQYGFLLLATDTDLLAGGEADLIRIKIWNMDQDGQVVYDSQMNDDEDSAPNTPVGGGSIAIHD